MEYTKKRTYQIDGDFLEILYHYDESSGMYFGDYPVFLETPRYTKEGRPWRNVCYTECPYADEQYNDCGSCQYLKKEHDTDLIGVCQNEACKQPQSTIDVEI